MSGCSNNLEVEIKALRGSVEKWERVAFQDGRDEAVFDCPLCAKFMYSPGECLRCPIRKKTGRPGCAGTPIDKWDTAFSGDIDLERRISISESADGGYRAGLSAQDAAIEMWSFLIDLLKEKEAKRCE